jgi:hypothetical protein
MRSRDDICDSIIIAHFIAYCILLQKYGYSFNASLYLINMTSYGNCFNLHIYTTTFICRSAFQKVSLHSPFAMSQKTSFNFFSITDLPATPYEGPSEANHEGSGGPAPQEEGKTQPNQLQSYESPSEASQEGLGVSPSTARSTPDSSLRGFYLLPLHRSKPASGQESSIFMQTV